MDPEKVEQFNLLMDSDDDRDADVKYQIALCYLKGEGVEADPQLAETYLRDAAELGSEEAAALLQRQTAPQQRAPVTAETFPDDCRLAEEGDIEAQYAVAHYLLAQDPQHAAQDADVMRYLLSAADQGNADACLELARLLRPTRPEEALQYYTNAADVSAEACRELAICLAEGIGTAPDPARAEGYFVRAATVGSAEEKLELAKRYSIGWGVPKSVVKANSWLRQAELAGMSNARERIDAELAQARAAAEAEQRRLEAEQAARRRAEEKQRRLRELARRRTEIQQRLRREAGAKAERHRLAAEEVKEKVRNLSQILGPIWRGIYKLIVFLLWYILSTVVGLILMTKLKRVGTILFVIFSGCSLKFIIWFFKSR